LITETRRKDKISLGELENVLKEAINGVLGIEIVEKEEHGGVRTADNFFKKEEILTEGFYIVKTSGTFFKKIEEVLLYVSIIATNAIRIERFLCFSEEVDRILGRIEEKLTKNFNIIVILKDIIK
jgi:hypothetical protein